MLISSYEYDYDRKNKIQSQSFRLSVLYQNHSLGKGKLLNNFYWFRLKRISKCPRKLLGLLCFWSAFYYNHNRNVHFYDYFQVQNQENVCSFILENSLFENLASLFPFGVIQLLREQDEVGRWSVECPVLWIFFI